MLGWAPDSIKQKVKGMQWLDRWAFISAGAELSYIANIPTETFQH